MADSLLLVFVPHEQTHRPNRACSILHEAGIMTPNGTKVQAVKIAMKPRCLHSSLGDGKGLRGSTVMPIYGLLLQDDGHWNPWAATAATRGATHKHLAKRCCRRCHKCFICMLCIL